MHSDSRKENVGVRTLPADAAARVEHFFVPSRLEVTNLDEVEREDNPPLRYAVA